MTGECEAFYSGVFLTLTCIRLDPSKGFVGAHFQLCELGVSKGHHDSPGVLGVEFGSPLVEAGFGQGEVFIVGG